MLNFNLRARFMALVMTGAVASCGGGGGESDVAAPAPRASSASGIPASASQSVDGLVAFVTRLIDTMTNDTSEPILLGDTVLPVSDTI